MWAAWVVAAIALAGCGFMLRFLIAMLREGAPSVCYWIVPVRRGPEREIPAALSSDDVEDDWSVISGQFAVAQRELPATKPAGIPLRRLRPTGFPGRRIFLRLRIGPPWQSW